MRSRFVSAAALLLAASFLLAQSPSPAPAAAPATLLWTEGDKSSELTTTEGVEILVLHGAGADVAVHVSDLHEYSTRVWADILNHGPQEITVDPGKATFEVLKPKRKMLSPLEPEKLAGKIKSLADVEAADRASSGCPYLAAGCSQNSSGVASSKEVQQVADAVIADVRSTAWHLQTLKPSEQAHGAIFFPYTPRRDACLVRIPVAGQVFQFPACRGGTRR